MSNYNYKNFPFLYYIFTISSHFRQIHSEKCRILSVVNVLLCLKIKILLYTKRTTNQEAIECIFVINFSSFVNFITNVTIHRSFDSFFHLPPSIVCNTHLGIIDGKGIQNSFVYFYNNQAL